jgi:hypothetical protein
MMKFVLRNSFDISPYADDFIVLVSLIWFTFVLLYVVISNGKEV